MSATQNTKKPAYCGHPALAALSIVCQLAPVPDSLTRRLPDLTLLGVGLFTIAYFLLNHEGIYDYDDYTYGRFAHQLATGTFRLDAVPDDYKPLHERWLVFGPVALLYRLFGVNIFTTTLWPLAATLGCLGLIGGLYRRRAPLAASAALLLLGLHYFSLDLSTYLYPDNILMCLALASAAALLRGRQAPRHRQAVWGAGFAGLNLLALLSKETILYYLPFYLLLGGRDLWRGRHRRFWAAAALTGAGLLLGYLGVYYYATGNAFYRLAVIEHANKVLQGRNYLAGKQGALWARITYQPLLFFWGTGLGAALLLAVRSCAQWRLAGHAELRFWLALAGSSAAFYWLGSTSLTSYNPNSLVPRMLTPLLPPLCLAAGFGLSHFMRTGRGAWVLALGLLAGALGLRSSVSVMYGGLGVFFALAAVVATPAGAAWRRPSTGWFAGLTLLAVAGCLAIRPVYFMVKPSNSAYFAQRRLVDRYLKGPGRGVVLVDDFLLRNYDFYYGYEQPAGLRYQAYARRDTTLRSLAQPAWLLLNRSILTNDNLTPHVISYSADQVLAWFPQRHLVARDGNVELYRLSPP